MKLAGLAVAAMAAAFVQKAAALPQVDGLGAEAVPASLTAAQVASGQDIVLALPSGTPTVRGVPASPAPGLVSLAARSAANDARLYAFAAHGVLRSADLYTGARHWRLVAHHGAAYWVPAADSSLPLAEPYVSRLPVPAAASVAAKAAAGAGGTYEIRLLVLYTPRAAEVLEGHGNVVIEAQRLTAMTNGIYQTNGVPAHFTLTAVSRYEGTQESQDFYANLDSMVGNPGVAALRNDTASDLVVLLRAFDNGELCGLSSGFNPDEHSDPPQNVNPERDAFNVVALSQGTGGACSDDVMAHELGHSLSAGHDWASSLGYAYWKPYAHALACLDAARTRYFSMMWGIGMGPGGGRGDLITNAAMTVGGNPPCGSAGVDGVDASQADNVRAMREAAPYVAAYRGGGKSGNDAKSTGVVLGAGMLGGLPLLLALGLLRLARGRARPGR